MRTSGQTGFSLIEAAIAIAVVAILAGAAAPLALKVINQQREAKTRDNLKIAFEAMFGARDRRTVNMRADFGFNPAGSLANLGAMTLQGAMPAYNLHGGAFNWGWNGPYWTGNVDNSAARAPLDAWGNPLQLRLVPGIGFQVISMGANAQIDTPVANPTPQVDDLVYPTLPVLLSPGYAGTLNVSLNNAHGSAITAVLNVTYELNGVSTPWTSAATPLPGGPLPLPAPPVIPAGVAVVTVTITNPLGIPSQSQIVDLLPGESKTLAWTVN
jgi:prepilin-type N-terminal cleavage/methylation domain-containing protein